MVETNVELKGRLDKWLSEIRSKVAAEAEEAKRTAAAKETADDEKITSDDVEDDSETNTDS